MIDDIGTDTRPAGWVILRTAGPSTMRLANTLIDDGIAAWTPVEMVKRRLSRRRKIAEQPVPMAPTIVFADASQLPRLAVLATKITKRQPPFSVFRHAGGIPVVRDAALEPMRTAERKAVPVAKREALAPGTAVRMTEGAFAGMSGVVERSKGKFAFVCFGGAVAIKIEAFLLTLDEAKSYRPLDGRTPGAVKTGSAGGPQLPHPPESPRRNQKTPSGGISEAMSSGVD